MKTKALKWTLFLGSCPVIAATASGAAKFKSAQGRYSTKEEESVEVHTS